MSSGVRRWSALGTWVLVIAALVVGQAIEKYLPDPQESARPFSQSADIRTPVPLRIGDVEVTDVVGSTSATASTGNLISPAVIVVAAFRFTARHNSATIARGVLTAADGRTYTVNTSGTRGAVRCVSPPPGVAAECSVAIEAPADALPGATLTLGGNLDDRFDDVAVVDLKISQDDAARWAAAKDPVEIPTAHLAGLG